jgi:hypothetical protein
LPELQKVTFNVDFKTGFQFIVRVPYVFSALKDYGIYLLKYYLNTGEIELISVRL